MANELSQIRAFLAASAPFDRLGEDEVARAARQVTVRYARAGETILEAGTRNEQLFVLRSGAVELRLAGEELTMRLGQGGCFAYPSLLRGGEVRNTTRALEDTLLYCLPAEEFHRLREACPAVADYFNESENERIRSAVRDLRANRSSALQHATIDALLTHKQPVSCGPDLSVAEAAALMSARDVSTLAVCDEGRLVGIFTDKDLRTRVVAAQRPFDTPIAEVMTSDPRTLPTQATAAEAMALMAAGGFRHIPVRGGAGELVAILSATDILAHLGDSAIDTGMLVAKAATPEALIAAAQQIPEGLARMEAGGFHAEHVMRFTSALGEAVHRRAAELAETEFGPPPVPYTLVAFGSLARGEQLVGSDQDNGLVIDDSVDDEGRAYFERLGTRISDLLDQCGFVYCKGGIMAKNPEQRLTLGEWRDRYARWIANPDEDRVLRATIYFDMRPLHGDAALVGTLHKEVVERTQASGLFVSFLARDAQRSKVPLGFFRNLVLEKSESGRKVFDAKAQAILPVIDIARTFALSEGLGAIGTTERLEALAEAGRMARGDAESLKDAFLLVNELRIAHHAAQVRRGEEPDNALAPSALSPLERDYLKDAFQVIAAGLDSLKRNLAGGLA
ncbi:DUF294 nucleotidyltransferase-like domain-containing protein [Qipengyuania flava]|uniref:DUF294 nucleotidyltransferase-like domain-containing protein n=1 Tax=Qipengyuania flava TaxID=192812 RepID=UPI001C633148|nr:DUF294 nucleotidyltransferase-like domain-containing protein [Qipengyuania flava]QYJ07808.1 CBS domain-containing protein [Qipengyuania flava]